MADTDKLPLDAQIALVEKRMALRRERIAANFDETRLEARRATQRATRFLPLVGAVTALAVGFAVARHRRRRVQVPAALSSLTASLPTSLRELRARSARLLQPAPAASPAARGFVTTALAIGAATLRFALSSEGRLAWRAFNAAKDHAQRYRRRGPGTPRG